MVVVLCAFVQGQSSNAVVKEKGPHGAGLLGSITSGCCSDSQLLKQATGRRALRFPFKDIAQYQERYWPNTYPET